MKFQLRIARTPDGSVFESYWYPVTVLFRHEGKWFRIWFGWRG